jgi:hypothetical protein
LTTEEPSRCVHCGQALTKPTPEHVPTEAALDHVFPRSWYPDTTPEEVQYWKVPCCRRCNGNLGKAEKELFSRLALCVDPRKAQAAGLSARVMRSMGIGTEGLSPKELEHRRAHKLKIIRSTKPYEPGTETFPGMGPHPGFPEREQLEVGIPADLLYAVTKKMVRGCEYALANRIVEEPYDVAVYFVDETKIADQVARVFEGPSAKTTTLGPGFSVTRAAANDEPNAVMYKIIVWGTLVIYASIMPRDAGPTEPDRPSHG